MNKLDNYILLLKSISSSFIVMATLYREAIIHARITSSCMRVLKGGEWRQKSAEKNLRFIRA